MQEAQEVPSLRLVGLRLVLAPRPSMLAESHERGLSECFRWLTSKARVNKAIINRWRLFA